MLAAEGIPILYYGSEQAYSGGSDPLNREPLWLSHMLKDSEIYRFIQRVMATRKKHEVWKENWVERWVDEKVLVGTRGHVMVVLSNNDEVDKL